MPAIPKDSLIPPGGHHFIEKREGHPDVRIEGASYREVAGALLKHRLANKVPPGDPLLEVYGFVCSQWPHFCDSIGPVPTPRSSPQGHISSDILAWMNNLWKRQAQAPKGLVQDGKAQRRAEVCARCPKNVEWTAGGCGTCISTAQQVGYVYRAGKGLPSDSSLLGCSVLRQDNRTAVWSDNLPDMTPEQEAALPSHCWRKKDL